MIMIIMIAVIEKWLNDLVSSSLFIRYFMN
jgi:hypothetical protein